MLTALVAAATLATPASADELGVKSIDVQLPGSTSGADLTFDQPIDTQQAEDIRRAVSSSLRDDQPSVETLACNAYTDHQDANGFLTLQLTCLPDYGVIAWGFRLSPQVQATAVGPVSEDGLQWWQNSEEQARNAPHVVPSDYLFHGRMRPVYVNDILDYQDVFTFRHNIGPGGTMRVTFAGSVQLTY